MKTRGRGQDRQDRYGRNGPVTDEREAWTPERILMERKSKRARRRQHAQERGR